MSLSGIHLDETRAVLAVAGEPARGFLQGLVSNDMAKVAPGQGILAALLTPQGKLITDFFITLHQDTFLLDVPKTRAADLLKRLTFYRLRTKVTLADLTKQSGVAIVMGDLPAHAPALAAFPDPRHPALGHRLIGPHEALKEIAQTMPKLDFLSCEQQRIALHLPASADLEPERFFLLDINFEEANGVDFRKGCYVGQEVTSRMKHRASARKRLIAVRMWGKAPTGATVVAGDQAIGELRASVPDGAETSGLALLRLDRLEEALAAQAPLTCNGNRIEVLADNWWRTLVHA